MCIAYAQIAQQRRRKVNAATVTNCKKESRVVNNNCATASVTQRLNNNSNNSNNSNNQNINHIRRGIALAALLISMIFHCITTTAAAAMVADVGASHGISAATLELSENANARLNALMNIQRSLEQYSLVTMANLLKRTAFGELAKSEDLKDSKGAEHLRRYDSMDTENLEELRHVYPTPTEEQQASTSEANATSANGDMSNVGLVGNATNIFGNFLRVRVNLKETRQRRTNNSLEMQRNNDFFERRRAADIPYRADAIEPAADVIKYNNKLYNDDDNIKNKRKNETSSSVELVELKLLPNEDANSVENENEILPASRRRLRSASTRFTYTTSNNNHDVSSTNNNSNNGLAGSSHSRHSQALMHHHHRRRRKGCPPMHGKDQLLCPSRNSRRYDVCIMREQLCNHVEDCPNGEDEDASQCFFYKPLDDQLKTLSHAVLLLVESVMSEQQRKRDKARTEDL